MDSFFPSVAGTRYSTTLQGEVRNRRIEEVSPLNTTHTNLTVNLAVSGRSLRLGYKIMRGTGLEPARPCGHTPLKRMSLPVSPPALYKDSPTIPNAFLIFNRLRRKWTSVLDLYIFLKILMESFLAYLN